MRTSLTAWEDRPGPVITRFATAAMIAALLPGPSAGALTAAEDMLDVRVEVSGSEVEITFTGGGAGTPDKGPQAFSAASLELMPIEAPLVVTDAGVSYGKLATLYLHGETFLDAPAPLPLGVQAIDTRLVPLRHLPFGDESRARTFSTRTSSAPKLSAPSGPLAAAGDWAFWGETGEVRGQPYRALHVRIVRLSAGGGETWQTLELHLATDGPEQAGALARRLRPSPPGLANVEDGPRTVHRSLVDPRSREPGFLLRIRDRGVYAVSISDLRAQGWNGGPVTTGDVSLSRHGVPVPVWFDGGDDGLLDRADDALLFYGDPAPSPFHATTTYWLSFAAGPGLTLETRMVSPAPGAEARATITRQAEEDREYWLGLPHGEGRDHWFWNRLSEGELYGGAPFAVDLVLDQRPVGRGHLSLDLQGKSEVAHHLAVNVNGRSTGDIQWRGAIPWSAAIELTPGTLDLNPNRITVSTMGGSLDLLYLDRIELTYDGELRFASGSLAFKGGSSPRAYALTGLDGSETILLDVTDPLLPVSLVGAEVTTTDITFDEPLSARSYFAASRAGWRSPEAIAVHTPPPLLSIVGADYLVLAPELWAPEIAPLADHHRSRGLIVEIVAPEDAYRVFGYGEPTPVALHTLLAHAYADWSPVPRYVLLVGDATYDFRDLLGGAPDPALPTLPVETPTLGEVGSDNALADVAGDDGIPEFAVGRIPGRSAEEIRAAVDKTLAYAEVAAGAGAVLDQPWLGRLHIVADNGSVQNPFERAADALASMAQTAYEIERSYLSSIGSVDRTRAIVHSRLDAGSLLAMYIGHGNVTTWAAERILDVEDIDRLANGNRTPLVLALNCLNGFFSDAASPVCLAEAFLGRSSGGAVGVWAPAGLGFMLDEQALAQAWLDEMFARGERRIGDAILDAKARHAVFPGIGPSRELLDGYTWFGDPALEVALPSPRAPDTFRARATSVGIWLRWDATGAVRVWRAAAGADSMEVATVEAGEEGWVDAETVSGSTYRYAVQSVNEGGFVSPFSPWVEVTAGQLAGDGQPPSIRPAIPSPCADCAAPVTVAIGDLDGIPCERVSISLDGSPLAPGFVTSDCEDGEVAADVGLEIRPCWEPGEHRLVITAEDGAEATGRIDRVITVCEALRVVSLRLSPAPIRETLIIDVAFNRPVHLEAQVVNPAGRVLRRLDSEASRVEHRLAWDGRDANGARTGSGFYVVRLRGVTAGGEIWAARRKVILVR